MTFIDICAGIGGFRVGLEEAGHKCIGFCEKDKFAVASYTAMYCITKEQYEYLKTLPFLKRQKEILKEVYRNGEYFANDVGGLGNAPKVDIWCFGFPCQDISIAGKKSGLGGARSGIFYSIIEQLKSKSEEDKPEILLIENVKNLLSVNDGWDFAKVLFKLDKAGYDVEWEVLNSKHFGVPQNRERIFIIGHLRGTSGRKIFSIQGTGGENNLRQLIGGSQGQRIYDSKGIAVTLSSNGGGHGSKTGLYFCDLTYGTELKLINTARCLKSRYNAGVTNRKCDNSGVVVSGRIRRLTPKECFRLQGFSDELFEKAAFVNSDTQLYKQAGNAATVNVIKAIGKRIGEKNEC